MKIISTILLMALGLFSFGQNVNSLSGNESKEKRYGLEFFAFPGLLYNSVTIGMSCRTSKTIEHNIRLGSFGHLLGGGSINLNLGYNLNTYFRNGKSYMPFWFRAANTIRDVGYEEGYYPNTLRFALGTGFGHVFKLGQKWGFRSELGLGASLNLTNSDYHQLPLRDFGEYGIDKSYPDQNPPVFLALRIRLEFIRYLYKREKSS